MFGGVVCSGGVALQDGATASVVGVRCPSARRWRPLVVGELCAGLISMVATGARRAAAARFGSSLLAMAVGLVG
jgi:hypothetical protein